MVRIPVLGPRCHTDQVIKGGKTKAGQQHYKCQNADCPQYSFLLDPAYKGRLPESKQQVIDMRLNGSGMRDTARVLKMSPTTVMHELKKSVDTHHRQLTPPPHVAPWRRGRAHPVC